MARCVKLAMVLCVVLSVQGWVEMMRAGREAAERPVRRRAVGGGEGWKHEACAAQFPTRALGSESDRVRSVANNAQGNRLSVHRG